MCLPRFFTYRSNCLFKADAELMVEAAEASRSFIKITAPPAQQIFEKGTSTTGGQRWDLSVVGFPGDRLGLTDFSSIDDPLLVLRSIDNRF